MPRLGPRIAIIGNAGGGKTTLARRLGARLDIPVTHVDSVQYQPHWQRTETRQCDHLLNSAADGERWIIDGFGNYDVIERRLELADTVVFVDYPIWRHYWWAIRRQWASRHGQRSELPENCAEFTLAYSGHLFRMMWYVHRHYRPWFLELVNKKRGSGQVIVIRNPTEWHQLLEMLDE